MPVGDDTELKSTIEEYLTWAFDGSRSNNDDRQTDARFYYRGEPSAGDPLKPKLLREPLFRALRFAHNIPLSGSLETDRLVAARRLQISLLSRLRRYTPTIEFGDSLSQRLLGSNFGESLSIAQHYSLPTLLTDWSTNPLVALFFAVSRRFQPVSPVRPPEALVWRMKLKPRDERIDMTIYLGENYDESTNSDIRRLLPSALVRNVLPVDLDQNVIVVPPPLSRRVFAQSARFIYCGRSESLPQQGTDRDPYDEIESVRVSLDAIPSGVGGPNILERDLRWLGVHQASMLLDPDAVAQFITDGWI